MSYDEIKKLAELKGKLSNARIKLFRANSNSDSIDPQSGFLKSDIEDFIRALKQKIIRLIPCIPDKPLWLVELGFSCKREN